MFFLCEILCFRFWWDVPIFIPKFKGPKRYKRGPSFYELFRTHFENSYLLERYMYMQNFRNFQDFNHNNIKNHRKMKKRKAKQNTLICNFLFSNLTWKYYGFIIYHIFNDSSKVLVLSRSCYNGAAFKINVGNVQKLDAFQRISFVSIFCKIISI